MLGDAMTSEALVQVTCEEVPRGDVPSWLTEHIARQALGPTGLDSDRFGRILIVYPTEESRKQALVKITSSQAVDMTLHHTITYCRGIILK